MKECLFASRVSELLAFCGKSQKEIAAELGIAEGNLTNWKKGENFPSLDVLFRLCLLLDESADYLLGLKD